MPPPNPLPEGYERRAEDGPAPEVLLLCWWTTTTLLTIPRLLLLSFLLLFFWLLRLSYLVPLQPRPQRVRQH